MGALRDRITDEMILRGFSESTIKAYTATLSDLSRFLSKPLLRVTDSDIKSYFLHLFKERHLSIAAVIVAASALKFFLRVTGRAHLEKSIPRIKRPEQVALVMNKAEIQAFFDALDDMRKRAIFATVFCAGLRVGEVCRLELRDIDSERRQIRIRGGKGRKDRYTVLFPENLAVLQEYLKEYRPSSFLFYPKGRPRTRLRERRVELMFRQTRMKAGIERGVTVHTLRHTFATTLLESGVNVFVIQRLLGHSSLATTMRYFHLRETAFSDIPSPLRECSLKTESLKHHDQMQLGFSLDGLQWR